MLTISSHTMIATGNYSSIEVLLCHSLQQIPGLIKMFFTIIVLAESIAVNTCSFCGSTASLKPLCADRLGSDLHQPIKLPKQPFNR